MGTGEKEGSRALLGGQPVLNKLRRDPHTLIIDEPLILSIFVSEKPLKEEEKLRHRAAWIIDQKKRNKDKVTSLQTMDFVVKRFYL